MNIESHIDQTLNDLDEIGVLSDILFIGAWARYFYKYYFPGANYHPRFATKDLDLLLPRESKLRALKIDLHQRLLERGYDQQFFNNGMIKYYKNELELEFLLPTTGEKKVVSIKAYNLKAQELPYLDMLWNSPVSINYNNHQVKLPDPWVYIIHKLIIAQGRSSVDVRGQDIQDAEEVLVALQHRKSFLTELEQKLNKKSKSKIIKSLGEFIDPYLRDTLLGLIT